MAADYTLNFYNPAAEMYRYLTGQSLARAKAFSDWRSRIKVAWSDLYIKDVQASVVNGQLDKTIKADQAYLKVGSVLDVKVLVKLGRIKPDDVSVELYNGHVDAWGKIINGSSLKMDYREPVNRDGECWFEGKVKCTNSGRQGFAVRILPRHQDLVNPNELGLILWEKSL
jgi:starch phosphorylase